MIASGPRRKGARDEAIETQSKGTRYAHRRVTKLAEGFPA